MLKWLVFPVIRGFERPRLVRLDERDIERLDADDAMHFAEVGLQVDLIHPNLALLDVADVEADDRFLVGAKHPLGGHFERFLRELGDSGNRVVIAAFGREFLIEFECLFILAELLFQQTSALQHGRAGFGAFWVLAHQLRPLLDGTAVAGGDGFLRALGGGGVERLGFVDGSEQKENPRRAFI